MTEEKYGRALAAWIATGVLSQDEEQEEVREYARQYGLDTVVAWERLADYAEAQGYNGNKEAVCG